jgi:hypothetical protein
MTYSFTVARTLSQARDQGGSLEKITQCISNLPKWRVSKTKPIKEKEFNTKTGKWEFEYTLYFYKDGGKQDSDTLSNEWSRIIRKLNKILEQPSFKTYPWLLKSVSPEVTQQGTQSATLGSAGIQFGAIEGEPKDISSIKHNILSLIDSMLHDDDELRRRFPGIFDREPQIRTMLSAVQSFLNTDGKRRNHVLLWGLPACAKTQILLNLAELLGPGAVIRLDATSTTQAGIYKLFLDDLKDSIVPPFVVIEEIEKCHEDALRVWLGALDDRGELRKVNFRMNENRKVRVLTLATANDKTIFDKLMGGTDKRPGALSSRFVNQLHCPRPNEKVLRKILERDIDSYGGHTDWIDPALDLARALKTDDPRKVLSFLDGGDRLLNGMYQYDILKMHTVQAMEDEHCSIQDRKVYEEQLRAWEEIAGSSQHSDTEATEADVEQAA